MVSYNDADLRTILDSEFIMNPDAFGAGRRNDDVVDSMCIAFALNIDWIKDVYDKWAKQNDPHYYHINGGAYFTNHIEDHYCRVKKWLEAKEQHGYNRGEHDIMVYAINY